jgi:hypothetical protein
MSPLYTKNSEYPFSFSLAKRARNPLHPTLLHQGGGENRTFVDQVTGRKLLSYSKDRFGLAPNLIRHPCPSL